MGNDMKCLRKLKSMREQIDWEMKEERDRFLRQLYHLVENWKGQLPKIREILRPEEVDWLLTEDVMNKHKPESDDEVLEFPLIKFVIKSGYKDKDNNSSSSSSSGSKPSSALRNTPVHYAARRGFGQAVNDLFVIYNRRDVNYTDERGETLYRIACEFGCRDAVEKYLEQGQDPNCHGRKSDDESNDPPLHLALRLGHDSLVQLLLKHGADPNLANEDGLTPLHVICRNEYYKCEDVRLVELFFKMSDDVERAVNVDARDKLGQTPLQLAVSHGLEKMAETLLRRGADPNLPNVEGLTSLHIISIKDNDGGLANMLFETCGEVSQRVDVDAQDKLGNTPLYYALFCENNKVFELLLKRGADPNLANKEGSAPLHIICKSCDDVDLAKTLFQLSGDTGQPLQVNAVDKSSNTPLHYALMCHHRKIAELLLRRGANPNLANAEGLTALHIICVVDDPRDGGMAQIFFGVHDEARCQPVQIDMQDKLGRAPLHYALARDNRKLAELLLRRGSDPNLADRDGSTPLHILCLKEKDSDEKLAIFLRTFFEICDEKQRQVQVDAHDSFGETPLQLAMAHGLDKVAETLIRRGANPNLPKKSGSTPVHVDCSCDDGEDDDDDDDEGEEEEEDEAEIFSMTMN